jgi:Zn-finger nucleic acid-binding protein
MELKMLCPNDQSELRIADRNGVEIDYCPQCRGVWLDRGELDKIIDRAAGQIDSAGLQRGSVPPVRRQPDRDRYDDDDWDDRGQFGGRRRGWLGELFDFD